MSHIAPKCEIACCIDDRLSTSTAENSVPIAMPESSDRNAQLQLLLERTFTRLVDTERKLAAKTTELENTQATLVTIHTRLGGLLQPLETSQHSDQVRNIVCRTVSAVLHEINKSA